MTKIHQRVFATIAAVTFLGTSLAGSGFVIWQLVQDNKSKKNSEKVQNDTKSTNKEKGTNMLEGTKLAGFTPVDTVGKLEIQDLKVGTGEEASAGSTVTAHYTGALAKDGTIFQSSYDNGGQPFTSPLSGLIAGWQAGIPGMKVGGVRRLLIPAAEAYGANAQNGIPANSNLVFDIELLALKQ